MWRTWLQIMFVDFPSKCKYVLIDLDRIKDHHRRLNCFDLASGRRDRKSEKIMDRNGSGNVVRITLRGANTKRTRETTKREHQTNWELFEIDEIFTTGCWVAYIVSVLAPLPPSIHPSIHARNDGSNDDEYIFVGTGDTSWWLWPF